MRPSGTGAEEQSKDLVAGERSFRLAEGSVARTGLEVRAPPQPAGVPMGSLVPNGRPDDENPFPPHVVASS